MRFQLDLDRAFLLLLEDLVGVWRLIERQLMGGKGVDMFDKIATGGKTFADFQRGNIRKTLLNLKNAVEQEVSGIEGNVG